MTTVPTTLRRPSTFLLVAANLVPLAGVLFLGWETFPIMVLFWLENVMIGAVNVCKIVAARPLDGEAWAKKVFAVPFFCVHYGMFTFVHGAFVMSLFGPKDAATQSPFDVGALVSVIRSQHLGWAALALALSHLFSFGSNYIGRGEYRRATVEQLMMEPYGRVFVLHLTLILGAFLMVALKTPKAGLAMLIVLKVILDLGGHAWQHGRYADPRDSS